MPPGLARLARRRTVLFTAAIAALAGAGFCFRTWREANAALNAGREAAASAAQVPVKVLSVRQESSLFEPVLAASEFRSATIFHGDLYVCGNAALFHFQQGVLKNAWRLGHELPPYPLHSLAVRSGIGNPELWIATDGGGILTYDGNRFNQILPESPALRKISSMLPLQNGRMLVGTRTTGLFISNGKSLKLFHTKFSKTEITALAGDEDRFWVGTRNDGAWYWNGGEAVHIAEQLPDPQVLSITARGGKAWIGTPVGVAEFTGGSFARPLADGVFAQALAERNGTLWIGTVDQGIIAVPLGTHSPHPQLTRSTENVESVTAFVELSDSLAAVSPRQVFDTSTEERAVVAPDGLASDHITAIHQDCRGRLWIGYFDRGLDILSSSNLGKPVHLESDVLFCVNRVRENPIDGTIAVATANGLALFDSGANLREVLDAHSGLIASHVTDVLFRSAASNGRSMVIATSAGLSFLEPEGLSSLYAFQGLVNNHVYTVAENNGTLYAGTLGGVSTLRNGLVRASFTTANSALRQNWITASAVFHGNLYLGTYGAGVIRFDERGVASFPAFAHERVEISANAMLATSRALYAGTAAYGIAVLRRESSRWQFVVDGLPSSTVTALDEHGGEVYVGTPNGIVRISENSLLR